VVISAKQTYRAVARATGCYKNHEQIYNESMMALKSLKSDYAPDEKQNFLFNCLVFKLDKEFMLQ
jgi:hypothetical protein